MTSALAVPSKMAGSSAFVFSRPTFASPETLTVPLVADEASVAVIDVVTATEALRFRTHFGNQKVTVAAMQMAEKKVWAHRS